MSPQGLQPRSAHALAQTRAMLTQTQTCGSGATRPHGSTERRRRCYALRCFTNHQVALARFLDDGEVPLDNGLVERRHVRTALTRKN